MATKEELEAKLREAKELIEQLNEKLETVCSVPKMLGTVVDGSPEKGFITALVGGQVMAMQGPANYVAKAGDQVYINTMTKGIEKIIEQPLPGQVGVFKRIIDERFCEVEGQVGLNDSRVIYYDHRHNYEEGDHVLLDASRTIALRNLGKPAMKGFKVSDEFRVTWDDVGGLDEVRRFFREVFEAPLLHPEIYSHYGIKPPKGVLMTGPPGCGKSLIAKAVATAVTAQWTGSNEGGFISVKGPEILSPYVGMAEMKIRELFASARRFFDKTRFPAVIFIDEAESVMNRRGSGRSSDVDRTIVPAFLTEMDGLDHSGALVILATNRPELLDPAIVREGRIDKKIRIPRPGKEQAKAIFSIHLRHVPLTQGLAPGETAGKVAEYMFDEQHVLYEIVRKSKGTQMFTLGHITSGAMIATVCQNATQSAMSRDITTGKISGVKVSDLYEAINDIRMQNSYMDHKEEVADHVASYRDDVAKILKCEGVLA